MSVPQWLQGRFFPKPVAGYPVTDAAPVRAVAPDPNAPPALDAQRVEQERAALQRELDRLGAQLRRQAGP